MNTLSSRQSVQSYLIMSNTKHEKTKNLYNFNHLDMLF